MARKRIGLSAWAFIACVAFPAAAQTGGAPGLFPGGDVPRAVIDAAPRTDYLAVPATHAPLQPSHEGVQLSPPEPKPSTKLPLRSTATERPTKSNTSLGSSAVSVFAALAIVLGLFLTVVWLFRRGVQQPMRVLPKEAVELLGRLPLPGRQQGYLLRVGNKIVLAGFSTGGADVLAEITDPVEVDRLAGICRQDDPYSATGTFRTLVDQFFREKPRAGRNVATDRSPATSEDDDA